MNTCKNRLSCHAWKLKLKLIRLSVLKRLLYIARGGLVVMGAVMTMIGFCVVCVVELIALPLLMVLAAKRFVQEWRTDKKIKEKQNDGKKNEADE